MFIYLRDFFSFSLIFNSIISIDINVFIFLPLTFFFYPVTSQDKSTLQDFILFFYNKRLYKQTEVKLKIDFKSEIGCSDWLVTFNKRTNHGS